MGQGNGAVWLLLLEEEEERLPPVFFVLCVCVFVLWCCEPGWAALVRLALFCVRSVQCSVCAKATRRRAWRAKMATTTQHDSEHWGQCVCLCLVGWQRVVVRGVVVFVLKDGMEQRDGGGVRGFVWSFCRALVVVVVVKQPVCFCVCVCGHGKVLVAFWGCCWALVVVVHSSGCFVVFCGVCWQRTEDRGQRRGERSGACLVRALCVCGAAAVFFCPPQRCGWMDGWMVMHCVSQQQQQEERRRMRRQSMPFVCVCVTDGGAMIVWKSLAVDGVRHSLLLLLLLLHLLPCLSVSLCVCDEWRI